MYADEIRRAVEASSRITLPAVTSLLWRAYGEGRITEAEAEALSALIDARKVSADIGFAAQADAPQDRQRRPRTGKGSRPHTDASIERRRRWAASGRLPLSLAARFTLAEQAVLALVAAETVRRGDCRLSVPHLAALAGVAETTVRNAIREARKLGLLTVEERRVSGFRNLPNIVRIMSPEWTAWLRLARKGVLRTEQAPSFAKGGGCKSPNRTPTQVSEQGKTRTVRGSRGVAAGTNPPSRERSRDADARPRRCAR